jgi:hypothetical protein
VHGAVDHIVVATMLGNLAKALRAQADTCFSVRNFMEVGSLQLLSESPQLFLESLQLYRESLEMKSRLGIITADERRELAEMPVHGPPW